MSSSHALDGVAHLEFAARLPSLPPEAFQNDPRRRDGRFPCLGIPQPEAQHLGVLVAAKRRRYRLERRVNPVVGAGGNTGVRIAHPVEHADHRERPVADDDVLTDRRLLGEKIDGDVGANHDDTRAGVVFVVEKKASTRGVHVEQRKAGPGNATDESTLRAAARRADDAVAAVLGPRYVEIRRRPEHLIDVGRANRHLEPARVACGPLLVRRDLNDVAANGAELLLHEVMDARHDGHEQHDGGDAGGDAER